MKKEYIIPIFVPHLGCPNDCTFCNQKKISGQKKSVTENEVGEIIEYYLSNFKDDDKIVEVAFFGGSFTGIDRDVQESLLSAAYRYIKNGKVVKGVKFGNHEVIGDAVELAEKYCKNGTGCDRILQWNGFITT